MLVVSITETRLSPNSATNSLAPVGESARPDGSEPTGTGADTCGLAVLMPETLTTVAAARFATSAVTPSGRITTADGSAPVATLDSS